MWFRLVAYIIYKTFETKSEALYLGSTNAKQKEKKGGKKGSTEYNYMPILLNN